MPTPNAEEMLNEGFWGWQTTPEGTAYRVRLPPMKAFPLLPRTIGRDGFVVAAMMPPYLVAGLIRQGIDVMLCGGDGHRLALPGISERPHRVYVDGPYVPVEWRPIIQAALLEIQDHWPDKTLIFRPRPDFDPKVN